MGGAACVVAMVMALTQLDCPVDMVGLVLLCENMLSGNFVKPAGDRHSNEWKNYYSVSTCSNIASECLEPVLLRGKRQNLMLCSCLHRCFVMLCRLSSRACFQTVCVILHLALLEDFLLAT